MWIYIRPIKHCSNFLSEVFPVRDNVNREEGKSPSINIDNQRCIIHASVTEHCMFNITISIRNIQLVSFNQSRWCAK